MPVVIAVLLALLWVFALRRWYRQAPSPLESVEHQQRALDALQHAASRSRTGPSLSAGAPARPVPGVSVRAGRTQRSVAPIALALVGTLLLAGVGAVWWIGRSSTEKQSATSGTSPTSSTRRRAATTTTTTAQPTTTTTVPAFARATIATQSANSVVFAVDRPTFTVTIAASAPCWVRAEPAAAGGQSTSPGSGSSQSPTQAPLFEGTLHAGDTQPIPVNGGLVLRLGAANNVTLALDGQPLALPNQGGSTLDLTFNGSGNGA